tara:strand:- start:31 stop:561 length:531 start_codon:yes stop_codon:yes gene_type:complete
MGDDHVQKMIETGDPIIKAFYGAVHHAAGQVDGLFNLWEKKRAADIAKWKPLQKAVQYMRRSVTGPILQGVPPTSCNGDTLSVREARILLQGWLVIGMVCEEEYANYLASNARDPEAFRNWFEYAQARVAVYLTGHRDTRSGRLPPQGEPRTAAAALYALVHDAANVYICMTPTSF